MTMTHQNTPEEQDRHLIFLVLCKRIKEMNKVPTTNGKQKRPIK